MTVPWPAAVGLDVAAWTGWGPLTGWWAHRTDGTRDTWLTRGRPFERDGRMYRRRLKTGRWQSHLPEAGRRFGGVDKRHIGGRSTAVLQAYAAETRRAELVHWLGLAFIPLFGLWNPIGLWVAMAAYGVGANAPCIVSLRANRLRILAIVRRRS